VRARAAGLLRPDAAPGPRAAGAAPALSPEPEVEPRGGNASAPPPRNVAAAAAAAPPPPPAAAPRRAPQPFTMHKMAFHRGRVLGILRRALRASLPLEAADVAAAEVPARARAPGARSVRRLRRLPACPVLPGRCAAARGGRLSRPATPRAHARVSAHY